MCTSFCKIANTKTCKTFSGVQANMLKYAFVWPVDNPPKLNLNHLKMNRFMFELLGILNNLKEKKKPYSLVSKSVLFSLKQILPILKIFSHIYGYLMMLLLLLVCSFSVVFVSCTEDRHVSVSHYQTSQNLNLQHY